MLVHLVCLDCDRMISVDGDEDHPVVNGILEGCEGYIHRGEENAPKFNKVKEAIDMLEQYHRALSQKAMEYPGWTGSEDFVDAWDMIRDVMGEFSAEMLVENYKAADAESLQIVTSDWIAARNKSNAARSELMRHFGIA